MTIESDGPNNKLQLSVFLEVLEFERKKDKKVTLWVGLNNCIHNRNRHAELNVKMFFYPCDLSLQFDCCICIENKLVTCQLSRTITHECVIA